MNNYSFKQTIFSGEIVAAINLMTELSCWYCGRAFIAIVEIVAAAHKRLMNVIAESIVLRQVVIIKHRIEPAVHAITQKLCV